MLLPWQHSQVHTYHLIPINTTFCGSWHIAQSGISAQPKSWRPFVVSAAWLQFGNFLNSNRSSLLIPIHKEDYIILHHTTCNGPAPVFFFFSFGYKKLWQSCLRTFRPILQHAAVPDSPSAKPSANLLPNSFCFPTITPPAPRIPGTGPLSGAALNKETQMLRHTGRLAGHFYCISQYKDINGGRRQETKVCGTRRSLPAPTVVQPSSVYGKEKSKPYCKSWLTSENHLFSIGTN